MENAGNEKVGVIVFMAGKQHLSDRLYGKFNNRQGLCKPLELLLAGIGRGAFLLPRFIFFPDFSQATMAMAFEFGHVAVYANVFGNVILVNFKDQKHRQVLHGNRKDEQRQQYCSDVFHSGAKVICNLILQDASRRIFC